jgi:hypothetical protein
MRRQVATWMESPLLLLLFPKALSQQPSPELHKNKLVTGGGTPPETPT